MRSAVILGNTDPGQYPENTRKVFLYDIRDDGATSVATRLIAWDKPDFLVIWLKGKNVDCVFADDLPAGTVSLLEKAGFMVGSLEHLHNNMILRELISE